MFFLIGNVNILSQKNIKNNLIHMHKSLAHTLYQKQCCHAHCTSSGRGSLSGSLCRGQVDWIEYGREYIAMGVQWTHGGAGSSDAHKIVVVQQQRRRACVRSYELRGVWLEDLALTNNA